MQKPFRGFGLDLSNRFSNATCLLPFNEVSGNKVFNYGNFGNNITFETPDWEGSVLSFNGTTDYIKYTNANQTHTDFPITMVCCFKTPNNTSETCRICNMGDESLNSTYVAMDASIVSDWSYWCRNGTGVETIKFTGSTPQANTWYVMACSSFSSTEHYMYINGEQVTSSSTSATFPTNIDIIGVGALVRSSSIYSEQRIAYNYIFPFGITEADAKSLYLDPFQMFKRYRPKFWAVVGPTTRPLPQRVLTGPFSGPFNGPF